MDPTFGWIVFCSERQRRPERHRAAQWQHRPSRLLSAFHFEVLRRSLRCKIRSGIREPDRSTAHRDHRNARDR